MRVRLLSVHHALEDPTRLGPYDVTRHLGDTSTGRLFLATNGSGRTVVLTVAHAAPAGAPGFRERFAREARAAAVAPPGFVAAVLDVNVAGERPWLVTAHVPGHTLQSFIDERGPLGDAGVAALADRLATGLAALHGCGLTHGDITPSAVILAEDGPRLVGFGLARAAGPGYGTPGFQAPEQAVGITGADRVQEGPAVDMFALGCVLGFAATGRSPFAGPDGAPAAEVARRAADAEPDLATMADPVRSVVRACLSKDPPQRPSAVQVAALLSPEAVAPPPAVPLTTPDLAVPFRGAPSATWVGPPTCGFGADRRSSAATPGSMGRRGLLIALAVAAVVIAAGAGVALVTARVGDTPSAAGPATAPVSAARAPSAVVDPGKGATLLDPAQFGPDGPRFTTPSHNIACVLSDPSPTGDGTARCDVPQHTWAAPPKPADCVGDYGAGASVSGSEKGTLTCASDAVPDPGLKVLQYGQAVSYGGIVCDSQETGLRCVNAATGHGFRVARGSYDLF